MVASFSNGDLQIDLTEKNSLFNY